jgi:hypothetical protein
MGLHEESERKVAYGLARHAFEAGMSAKRHGKSADYEVGYITAVLHLAEKEDAEGLVQELDQMLNALTEGEGLV